MNKRIMTSKWSIVITLVIVFSFLAGNPVSSDPKLIEIEKISKMACKDVGIVHDSSQGTKGAPIIIMEEAHNSRAIQIQQAIALVRLHSRSALTDIALEGYLTDGARIDTEWFDKAARNDVRAKIEVAVRLLQEGEISSAEFIKLLYEDVSLHPIESSKVHAVNLGENAQSAPVLYLIRIGQNRLTEEHLPRIQRLNDEVENLKGAEKNAKFIELINYVLSVDPWVKKTADRIQSEDFIVSVSLEEHVKVIEEIKTRAKSDAIEFAPEEEAGIEEYIAFFKARGNADYTMVEATKSVSDHKKTRVVGMIIGQAHTRKVCELFKKDGRSFSVIQPMALHKGDKRGDLDYEAFERKYQQLSVFSQGFLSEALEGIFPGASSKKPKPALTKKWIRPKGELYLFTDRIVRAAFGGGGKEPPVPPRDIIAGFSDDDFRGEHVYVDPGRIVLVPADEKDKKKGEAVLFQAILNNDKPKRSKTIWIKAIPTHGVDKGILNAKQDHEFVEALLKEALQEVQSTEESSKSHENELGQVRITFDTLACFGADQKEVLAANLSTK